MLFLSSADFFQNQLFQKNSFRNTISVSNGLVPDQARHFVRPNLGPNCLYRLTTDDLIPHILEEMRRKRRLDYLPADHSHEIRNHLFICQ